MKSRNEKVLTKREYEVADLIAWGCSADEAADRLHVSPNTIRNTLRNIYEKLHLNKANELAAYIFCTEYGVNADKDKIGNVKRAVCALSILALFTFHLLSSFDDTMIRRVRSRGRRTETELVTEA